VNQWISPNTTGGMYYGTAATTGTSITLLPFVQQGASEPRNEGPLEWLRRSVSEITELAAA
jgi:hypothetical protein